MVSENGAADLALMNDLVAQKTSLGSFYQRKAGGAGAEYTLEGPERSGNGRTLSTSKLLNCHDEAVPKLLVCSCSTSKVTLTYSNLGLLLGVLSLQLILA